jgi:hypothetical protein
MSRSSSNCCLRLKLRRLAGLAVKHLRHGPFLHTMHKLCIRKKGWLQRLK